MKFATYGLIKTHSDISSYSKIMIRNRLIKTNIGTEYDHFLFVESDMPQEHKKHISKYINAKIIVLDTPCFDYSARPDASGYNFMCDFYAIRVWDYFHDYDYIMRLDDDSFILSDLRQILKDLSSEVKYCYLYVTRKNETHVQTNQTLPKFLDLSKRLIKNYYNNINICNPKIFSELLQSKLREIELSEGIFKHRWGDSSIQAILVDEEKGIEKRKMDISYIHFSHYRWYNLIRTEWKSIKTIFQHFYKI